MKPTTPKRPDDAAERAKAIADDHFGAWECQTEILQDEIAAALRTDLAREKALREGAPWHADMVKLGNENTFLRGLARDPSKTLLDTVHANERLREQVAVLTEALELIAGPSEFNCAVGEACQRAAAQDALARAKALEKGE